MSARLLPRVLAPSISGLLPVGWLVVAPRWPSAVVARAILHGRLLGLIVALIGRANIRSSWLGTNATAQIRLEEQSVLLLNGSYIMWSTEADSPSQLNITSRDRTGRMRTLNTASVSAQNPGDRIVIE